MAVASQSPILIIAALVGIALVHRIGIIIYRLYFHPLAKFPGPRSLAASSFPHGYYNWTQGTWYRRVLDLHRCYGPIVRVAPDRLAVDGSVAWEDAFGHKGNTRPEFPRQPDFYRAGVERENLFTADKAGHRRQRRLLSHAFSEAALYDQQPIITKWVDLLIQRFHEHANAKREFDVVQWYYFVAFDIIGDLTFGESFGCLQNSDMHPFVSLSVDNIRADAFMRFFLFYRRVFNPLISLISKSRIVQRRFQFMHQVEMKTRKRLDMGSQPDGRKDFMTYLLRHNNDKGMTPEEIAGNANALILAGGGAIATTLSSLTYYLTQSPRARQRLTDEIRGTFKTEAEISMKSTAALPYLHACLKEAMRIFPSAAETPPRVSPGDYINGQYIPQGTTIAVYQWATYHNETNFKQPDSFIPERWLPEDHPFYDPSFQTDNKTSFKPFSHGPRNCIAKALSYAELRFIVARILWNFDIELQPGWEKFIDRALVFIVFVKQPLLVKLRPVKRSTTT
ncbi:cytochrome P450 [Aspergillus leporis]|uniref:Cytochrome P450 n=1 Tax=Aspergillus leporis TaxID=41062 RepID=A0A5N5WL64_9EURO|nr:cytochrome P450 [Aspergillus leporis]